MARQRQRAPPRVRHRDGPRHLRPRPGRVQPARGRSLPPHRCPLHHGQHPPAGRGPRGGRDRGHRQAGRDAEHHQRHRRAALGVERGDLPRLPELQARQGRQRRRPGGARQGEPGAAPPAPGHRAADGHAHRPLRHPRPVHRGQRRAVDPGDDRGGRQDRPPSDRERQRRRRGGPAGRTRPAGERLDRPPQAAGLRPDRLRRAAGRRQPEPQPARRLAAGGPGAADPAPARPRRRARRSSGNLVLRNQDGRLVRVADVARIEDGQEEGADPGHAQRRAGGGAVGQASRPTPTRCRSSTPSASGWPTWSPCCRRA